MIERDGLVARVKTAIGPYLQRRMRETFEGQGSGLLTSPYSDPELFTRLVHDDGLIRVGGG